MKLSKRTTRIGIALIIVLAALSLLNANWLAPTPRASQS